MKKIYLILSIFGFTSTLALYGQTELSNFNATGSGYSVSSATDYQCIGINPANLGWSHDNHSMNIGFLETGFSIYSEAITKRQVTDIIFRNEGQLSFTERQQAAKDFTGKLTWGSLGITWLGFSWQDDKIGGFAVNIRERAQWSTVFNRNAANFLFLGFNDPYFDSTVVNLGDTAGYSTNPKWANEIYDGSNLHFYWYREYNFAYGRKILDKKNFKWYGGLGLKYLQAYGSFQYRQEGDDLTAYYALSPIFSINNKTPTPSQIAGDGLKKVGDGFGIDIGFSFQIMEKLRIALAVNDIGSITWNGNVYQGYNTSVWKISTSGITNYNIFEQGELIQSDNKPDDPGLWEGLKNKNINLPTHFRGGASYRFIPQLEAGFDLYVPIATDVPGYYEKQVAGLGLRYEPVKWVRLSAGMVSGGKFGTNMPFGITFYPVRNEATSWELGLATRDLISFFRQEFATVSAAFGFLRLSFGNKR